MKNISLHKIITTRLLVKTLLIDKGYVCECFDRSHHDVYKKKPLINVEVHRKLLPETMGTIYNLFADGFNNPSIKPYCGHEYRMSYEYLYVYIIITYIVKPNAVRWTAVAQDILCQSLRLPSAARLSHLRFPYHVSQHYCPLGFDHWLLFVNYY